jgi:Holliday junction resolvase
LANFGHNRERQLAAKLGEEGWWVLRAAGSLGVADLVALKNGRTTRMIEVKATKAGPFAGFGPTERTELLAAAQQAGAEAWLVHWPKHGKPKWIPPGEWPGGAAYKRGG